MRKLYLPDIHSWKRMALGAPEPSKHRRSALLPLATGPHYRHAVNPPGSKDRRRLNRRRARLGLESLGERGSCAPVAAVAACAVGLVLMGAFLILSWYAR